jgi:4-alpha-glucanotransferase
MNFPRASGLLLHPTSLPGEFGIGDLGPEAFAFVDLLAAAGQTYWQILPLGPTGYGDSPYNCFSAFAGNPLLISPELLQNTELITAEQAAGHPEFPDDRVDYGGVYHWKKDLLHIAHQNFPNAKAEVSARFDAFENENRWWLDDYGLYRAIKDDQGGRPWYEWPDPLKLREPDAVAAITTQLADAIRAEKVTQFLFFGQWMSLKSYANEHGIRIIGDIPIFVSMDSADVWCNRDKFKLHADGSPRVVSGVPPDYFSSTGQLWGNPIYDWQAMQADGFAWWTARVASALELADIVRIDHFVAFAAAWEVPGKDKTAENGEWVAVPGNELFDALQNTLGELPLIAEDLGVVTDEVRALRDRFGMAGMRVLQFAFGGDANDHHLPHNYTRGSVVYTGTHDNDTNVGWWRSLKKGKNIRPERDFCMRYLDTDGAEISWDMMRAAWSSVANTAIAPVQDVLSLGNEARMNLPASNNNNWSWRMLKDSISPELIERLRSMTETYGRTNPVPVAENEE